MGRQFGREWMLDVETPAEAIRALRVNLGPTFERYLAENDRCFHVLVGDRGVELQQLMHPLSTEPITIRPVVAGAKSKLLPIALGIGLIVISGPVGGFLAGSSGAFLGIGATALTNAVASMGISLVLGGVAQLLTKTPNVPDPNDRPENKPSYVFDGPVNTAAQGNVVPVGYGRLRVGGQVISAGMHAEQIAA